MPFGVIKSSLPEEGSSTLGSDVVGWDRKKANSSLEQALETVNGFESSSSGSFRDLSLFMAAPMAPSASNTLYQSEISSKIPQNLSNLQIPLTVS